MTQWNGVPATNAQLEALALSGYGSYTFFQSRDRAVRGLGTAPPAVARQRQPSSSVRLRPRTGCATWCPTPSPIEPCSVRVTLIGRPGGRARRHRPGPRCRRHRQRPRGRQDPPALSVRTTRYARETPHVKHRGTHGLTRETRAARHAGFDDALLVGPDGTVTEGTTWNLLLHDGEQVGVAGGADAAGSHGERSSSRPWRQAGTAHRSEPVDAHDVPAYAAAFALNSSVPGRAITAVDGHWLTGHAQAAAGAAAALGERHPRTARVGWASCQGEGSGFATSTWSSTARAS